MGNPEKIIFGICSVCGADAGDKAGASGADSSSNIDSTGNGVILMYYNGQLMCEVCKNRLSSDQESIDSAQRHADEQRFRDSAGFVRSVSEE